MRTPKTQPRRFVIDRIHNSRTHARAAKILAAANKKRCGRRITFEQIADLALSKITDEDMERLKHQSLTDMEKADIQLRRFNRENKTRQSLELFLLMGFDRQKMENQ